MRRPTPKVLMLVLLATTTLTALVTGILVWQFVEWESDTVSIDSIPEASRHFEPRPEFESVLGEYTLQAVVSDAPNCSDIGRDVLREGGKAADAAIATMVCVGLIQSQSMGLGGGFFLVYYDNQNKVAETLTARERAPSRATEDMFDSNPGAASRGGLAVAIPGELKGYWMLYKKHGGGVPWKRLFEPTIELAERGFVVTRHAANALSSGSRYIRAEPSLAEVYVNKETNDVYKEGDIMRRPVLAETLREIANSGSQGDLLYQNSSLMKRFVRDLKVRGGIVTEEDMMNYEATWDSPVNMTLNNGFNVYSMPPPGSGLLLGFTMRLLSLFQIPDHTVSTYQKIVETFKHVYAKRTILGDPESSNATIRDQVAELRRNLTDEGYIEDIKPLIKDNWTSNDTSYYGAEWWTPDDHGTSHMSVIDKDGNAVALTSTINLYYGARLRSPSTGIIYNDEMDDFASPNVTNQFGVPPSKNNYIEPGKRPVSSMTPAIFTDNKGNVRLVIGGAGGTKITTSVATVAIRNLWFGEDIKTAIDARRIHHQLLPMEVQYEEGFDMGIIEGLRAIGHGTEQFDVGTSVINAIAVADNGTIFANADFRKRGTVSGD